MDIRSFVTGFYVPIVSEKCRMGIHHVHSRAPTLTGPFAVPAPDTCHDGIKSHNSGQAWSTLQIRPLRHAVRSPGPVPFTGSAYHFHQVFTTLAYTGKRQGKP